MTTLHEDVILDLLPAYFTDEASAASRAIVDAYFEAHPQFARTVRATQMAITQVPGAASSNGAHAAIKSVKQQLRWRSALIAAGIFCTISPFTFIFNDQRVVYFMWRDSPLAASFYTVAALLAWLMLWFSTRRVNTR